MWGLIINFLVGTWLVLSPMFLRMSDAAADNNHIAGPLILTITIISFWDINRNFLKANMAVAVWLIISPFLLNFSFNYVIFLNMLAAIVVALASLAKRKGKHRYGGGWKSLFEPVPPHITEQDQKPLP